MAYSKQTWDTNTNFTPSRMNHIEDGIFNAQAQAEIIPNASQIPYGASNVGSVLNGIGVLGIYKYNKVEEMNISGGYHQLVYRKQSGADDIFSIDNGNIKLLKGGIYLFKIRTHGYGNIGRIMINVNYSVEETVFTSVFEQFHTNTTAILAVTGEIVVPINMVGSASDTTLYGTAVSDNGEVEVIKIK